MSILRLYSGIAKTQVFWDTTPRCRTASSSRHGFILAMGATLTGTTLPTIQRRIRDNKSSSPSIFT